jgi:hypothetical protein
MNASHRSTRSTLPRLLQFALLGVALPAVASAAAPAPAASSAASVAPVASAAGPGADAAARQRYERERSVCLSGQSNQARDTCLQEAGAALAESRRGGLSAEAEGYQANQQRRCDALPTAQRKDCLSRMQGAGSVSGSVQSGGIYRELVTREPAASAPAAAGPAASGARP